MRLVDDFPRTNRQYPSLLNVGDGLHLRIGIDSDVWKLRIGGGALRLSRHGTFRLASQGDEGASLALKLPRKGWYPDGPVTHTIFVPTYGELYVRQDTMRINILSEDEWHRAIENKYSPRPAYWRRGAEKLLIEV